MFAKVLADEEDGFARALEELALKKSTNNEIFRHIKSKFDAARKEEDFHERNVMENFTSRRKKFTNIDTSIVKLRKRYSNMKQKWRALSERAKHGSGLTAEDEPAWYKVINPLFSETNEDIELTDNADLSFKGDYSYLKEDSDSTTEEEDSDDSYISDEVRENVVRVPKDSRK